VIRGSVDSDRQAILSRELFGLNGQPLVVSAAIDTGYDGILTITPDIAAALQSPFRETRTYELGNGELVDFPIHDVTLMWDEQTRNVAAIVTSGGVLVGMSLLHGFTLFIDVIDGGEIRIEPRP